MRFSPSKQILAGVAVVALIFTAMLASELAATNEAGYVQVIQQAGTGNMSVRMEPGLYPRLFAGITTYKISDVYDFNSKEDAIRVQFTDSSTADISGQIKFRMPMDPTKILQLNQDFRSYDAVEHDLVRQVVAAALKQSASLFKAEEVYSTRRSDFIALVNDQIKNGIYATTYTEQQVKDEDGNSSISRIVSVKRDAQGAPIVSEESAFKRYGIELVQLVVNDTEFDEKTTELIAERKKAQQQQVVARANAEKAKQDAITAEAQGRANVATATAEADVKKATAVIEAQQEKEVAAQQALQADEQKKAILAKGEAEAEIAKLKVSAGLSPLDRANIEKDTAIGVAHELAQVKLPQMMLIGGGNGGGQENAWNAVGFNAMMDINKKISDGALQGTAPQPDAAK